MAWKLILGAGLLGLGGWAAYRALRDRTAPAATAETAGELASDSVEPIHFGRRLINTLGGWMRNAVNNRLREVYSWSIPWWTWAETQPNVDSFAEAELGIGDTSLIQFVEALRFWNETWNAYQAAKLEAQS